MQNEKFSCVKEINKTIHIPVPSIYVTNEVVGVTEILESWKRQYVHQLHGIVVDYKNVSVTLNAGHIVTDKHFSHYDVNATFSVFCPVIGSLAKGTVNRISKAHIGCLILNTINVTIHLTKNLSYTKAEKFFQLDREIIFEISHFNFDLKVIRVNGEITEECISLMKSMYPDVVVSANASTIKSESTNTTKNSSSSSDESSESESILKESNTASHLTYSAGKKLVLTPVNKSVRSKHADTDYLGVKKNSDFANEVKDGERENIDMCPEDKMLKKKHKKKTKKQDYLQSADLGVNFKCGLLNEIKEEPNLSSSSIEVPNKQRKRKRESSFDQSFLNLANEVKDGKRENDMCPEDKMLKKKHKKKTKKHDHFKSADLGDNFMGSLLNEIKEEPSLGSTSIEVPNKQRKRKRESSSSFTQSSFDLTNEVKDGKSENDVCPEDKMLKKKHKKKTKKHDPFKSAELGDNFMCSMLNEIKEEPNLSSLSTEVPNKQRKRKRESSSSFTQSSFDLANEVKEEKDGERENIGICPEDKMLKKKHKKKTKKHDYFQSADLDNLMCNLLNKIKDKPNLSSSSIEVPNKQGKNVLPKKKSKSKSIAKSLEISDSKKEKKKKKRKLSVKNTPKSVKEKKHKKKISNIAKNLNFIDEGSGRISQLKVSEESSESSEEEIKIKIAKCDDELSEADLELLRRLENNSFLPEKCPSVNVEVKEETKSRQKVKKKKHKHSPDKKLKSIKEHSNKKKEDKALNSSKKKSSEKKDSKHKEKPKLGSKIKKNTKKAKDKKSKKSSKRKE